MRQRCVRAFGRFLLLTLLAHIFRAIGLRHRLSVRRFPGGHWRPLRNGSRLGLAFGAVRLRVTGM